MQHTVSIPPWLSRIEVSPYDIVAKSAHVDVESGEIDTHVESWAPQIFECKLIVVDGQQCLAKDAICLGAGRR